MRLTALEIQGFKSFPDKTKVLIGDGITSIVGPNGSGKSNISDAIRWVMGETSAKQLRGGGKMENVIFTGTQQRGAMGYAAVSLYIDNTDRRIEVDADEAIIGRKYYRSGDSEYSINGQNVRLKDVYELFLDTGLGRDGYSVIGQGRIAEIVGAKSKERREIFEEASGIAGYRYKKNEAERRLASAEDNLVRLRDILGELEARVEPLKKESEKAKRFLDLSAQRKELEVTLWVDTIHRARETLREQQRKIEISQSDYMRLGAEIDEIDAETEQTRLQSNKMIIDTSRLQDEIRSITEEMSGADAKIAVLRNNILHNTQSADNLREEIAKSGEGRQSLENEAAHHLAAIAECEKTAAELTEKCAQIENTLNELQSKSAESGERRGFIAGSLNDMTTRATDLKVQSASAVSSAEAAETRLEAAKSGANQAEENIKILTDEKNETQSFLNETLETLTKLENIKNGISMKLESRARALTDADNAEQSIIRQLEAAEQRVTLLKDLERSMDGFQHSVKTVMKAYENRRLRGIIGPVSTILTVKAGYEVAIETALGFALQNIVVENDTAAKAAMAFLRDEKAGRATFLPLNTVKPSFFDGSRLTGSAVKASELVSYDAKYESIVSSLLGRIVVVDDINEASSVAKALDYKNRIVTSDGQVINAGGSFTGGSVSRSAGLFSRKQEIDDLKQKINTLNKQREKAEEATDKAKAEVDALKAELTACESEAITAGGDKIRAEVELSRTSTALSQANESAQLLSAECETLENQIKQSREAAENALSQSEQLAAECAKLEAELSAISGDDDTFIETRTRLSNELAELKMQRLSAEKDAQSHAAALETLKARTGTEAERSKQLEENIATLKAQNEQHEAEIAETEAKRTGSRADIQNREQQIAALAAARAETEGSINAKTKRVRELQDEREKTSGELARLKEQKETKDAEYEETVSRLWDEYELALSDAEKLCTPFDSVTELRRGVADVRNKIKSLGNVNVGAIEEYAEVSERYEFMRAQVGDVEKGKAELLKLITGLSDDMREMFTENFAQINRNFARIFAELFGGGTAKLSLEDEADVLESGINIEVAPPGKIIKDLTALSGGEQALVAISIYFAILAVNPAPFCVLDEIEAALDDVNVTRYAQYLRKISGHTQFIVITHRRGTMEEADVLYGVTMQEDGISKILRLDVNNVDASLVS
ncbi:MAG: chromosome segregation protein SMC [Clostridia bacterium]|nr:chromosome segregation protein SMC [Clostridia bacterium]